MSETINFEKFKRKVSSLERIFYLSPYAIVTMVVRIKGKILENLLKNAISKVQQRHVNLRVRIYEDKDHDLWFISEGVKEIPIEIVSRKSDNQWIDICQDACKIPFDFENRPPIRFILVQSPEISELIILCHHIICDGKSLAYLAKDILTYLGEPTRKVEVLPNPIPVDKDNFPQDVSLNAINKYFIDRINKKWSKNQVYFDQEDYKNLCKAYWKRYDHQITPIELSEAQTSTLVERCRKEGVTVNTGLTTALVGSMSIIQGDKANPNIAIAGSVRDRLPKPAGESMGYFAGGVNLKFKYNNKKNFWDNARKLHQQVKPLYKNKNLFKELLTWSYLESGIMESISYKILGKFVPLDFSRYKKLFDFSKRDDVISSILKRENMDSLDKTFLGTAITNLTRLEFPVFYGALELDRLIMNPGGMFPLALVDLVVGVVTCSGKLSLLLEYEEKTVDNNTIEKIKEKIMELLLK